MQAPLVAGQIGARVINSGGTRIDGLSVTLDRDGAWTGFDGKLQVNAIPVSAAGRASGSPRGFAEPNPAPIAPAAHSARTRPAR